MDSCRIRSIANALLAELDEGENYDKERDKLIGFLFIHKAIIYYLWINMYVTNKHF